MPVTIERIAADGLTIDIKVTETPLALMLVVLSLEAAVATAATSKDSLSWVGAQEVSRVVAALKTALKGAGFWKEKDNE